MYRKIQSVRPSTTNRVCVCVGGGGGYLLQIRAKVLEYMPVYHVVIQSAVHVFGYFGAI